MKAPKVLRKYWLTVWALLAAIYLIIPKSTPLEGVAYWFVQIFTLPILWISKIFAFFGIAGDFIVYLSMPIALGIAYYINTKYLK